MKDFFKNRVVWLVIVILIVIGGGIWLANKDSSPNVSMNKELYDKCMADVNDKTFCTFAGAFGNVSAYKVEATSTSDSGTSTIEMSSDSKNNSQMVIKQNGQEQANVVSYNGSTYSKDYTDGKWFKYPAGDANAPQTTDLKKEFAKGDFKNDKGQKIDYVNSGTEACGDLTCYKYQVKDPALPEQQGYVWFDNKDYLMRKLTIKDSKSDTVMLVSYPTVTIAEPSPTKEVPAGTTGQ